ncbi:phosphatase PAP2 family protein [Paenibacillus sp. LHD-117]|uniref:phosphatase PAP2 family protein n=1 Tax=Paenibacillus sp. LHD-117 TaxID=3071412 RepID=UPI0027E07C10|nr:phosphatase PAP2 family protein [Paenibacillus sp. LHD-117]MDQ6420366.1 phosphatase PAP2 family protein [Paenibacillus sp. LHD-117]
MLGWIRSNEERMLIWANRRPVTNRIHALMDGWFSAVTHLGGATFTLLAALLCALLAPEPYGTAGWQSLLAVVISHIPVAIVKRKFKRLRPYQAMPDVRTCPKPLQDSSFPSGHTTAVFSWMVPFLLMGMIESAILAPAAFLIAVSVGWSRMYLGLHYPSDVAAGAIIGTATAFAVHYFWM